MIFLYNYVKVIVSKYLTSKIFEISKLTLYYRHNKINKFRNGDSRKISVNSEFRMIMLRSPHNVLNINIQYDTFKILKLKYTNQLTIIWKEKISNREESYDWKGKWLCAWIKMRIRKGFFWFLWLVLFIWEVLLSKDIPPVFNDALKLIRKCINAIRRTFQETLRR